MSHLREHRWFFFINNLGESLGFFAFLVLGCLLPFSPVHIHAVTDWYDNPGTNISSSGNSQIDPDIAINTAGTIGIAIWKEGTQTINASVLDVASNTWSTVATLSNTMTPTTVNNPKIAMNADGTLAVAIWIENSEVHSKRYSGGTWSEVANVLGSSPNAESLSLAMNTTNNRAIAGWGTATQALTSIFDGTSSWSTAKNHSDLVTTTVANTSVSMSSDGTKAAFAFSQIRASHMTKIIYADICTNLGTDAWSGKSTLSPDDFVTSAHLPSISMNSTGSLTRATWYTSLTGTDTVESKLCTGTSWGNQDILPAITGTVNPKVIISADGSKAILVYIKNTSIPGTVTARIWSGSWSGETPVSTTDTALATTFTGIPDLSKACALWVDRPSSMSNNKAATISFYTTGGGWAPQTTIGDPTLQADKPAIATNATGDILIATWRTGVPNQVQWSRYGETPPPPPPPPSPPPAPAPTPSVAVTGSTIQVGGNTFSSNVEWSVPENLITGPVTIKSLVVYRGLSATKLKPIKVIPVTNPTVPPDVYNDPNLQKGATYFYKIDAKLSDGSTYQLIATSITI